jgi:hypothetical protein
MLLFERIFFYFLVPKLARGERELAENDKERESYCETII